MKEVCVFCDRSQFEERLVAEDKNFYVIATLGQITDGGYVLLVPRRHLLCIGEMTAEGAAKLDELNRYLRAILVKEYGALSSGFEHGIGGQSIQHAHWHILPAAVDLTARIARDFPVCETNTLISIRDVPRGYALTKEPYLLWQTPDAQLQICYVHQGPEAIPKQYLRVATAEAVKRPERANWRTMDPELDRKLWSETVRRLRKYFR